MEMRNGVIGKDVSLECALKDCLVNPNMDMKCLTCVIDNVDDGIFLPALDDEDMEVKHLLQDPQNEEFLCISNLCSLEQQSNCRLTGRISGLVKEADLFAGNALSCFGPYFLENSLVDSKKLIKKTEPKLWVQDRDMVGGIDGISNLSNVFSFRSEASSEHSNCVAEDMGIDEVWNGIIKSLESDVSAKNKIFHKGHDFFGLENLIIPVDSFDPFQCCLTANQYEAEADTIWPPNSSINGLSSLSESVPDIDICTAGEVYESLQLSSEDAQNNMFMLSKSEHGAVEVGADIMCKQLCNLPQRYTEEIAEVNSTCSERLEISNVVTRERFYVVAGDKCHLKETKPKEWLSFKWDIGPITRRPRNLRRRRGHRRKLPSCLVKDNINKEDFIPRTKIQVLHSSKPQDYKANDWIEQNEEKHNIRGKKHKAWTLPEVMALIEGVSRYGVGKWTEIKKLSFPTSTLRTSVDLKDKWRNLIRACDLQLCSRNQDGQQKKQMTARIPRSVLRRIRELSAIHLYHSDRKTKTTGSKDANLLSS